MNATANDAVFEVLPCHADETALRWQEPDGTWLQWIVHDLAGRAARVAAGLRAQGLRPGDRVVLLLRSAPEFHVADTAPLMCGATPVTIDHASSTGQIADLAGNCAARAAVVEDIETAARFRVIAARLPALERVIVVRDPDEAAYPDVTP